MKKFLFFFLVGIAALTSCSKSAGIDGTTGVVTVTGALGVLGDTLPTSSLPDSVKNFILRNYPGATISVVEKEIRNGVTTYEVEILVGGVRKELYFSASWLFLNLRQGNCGNGDPHGDPHGDNHGRDSIHNVVIPAATLAAIKTTYPHDTVIIGKKEVHNGVTTYQVIIKNGSVVRFLTYDVNWVFVSISTGNGDHHDHPGGGNGNGGGDVPVPIANIPAGAKTYISTNYAGFTIAQAKSEVEQGVTTYEVQVTKGTTQKWLVFSAAWVFLREEH